MSNGATLPNFISYKGHDAVSLSAPFKFQGTTIYAFSLASDPSQVQVFVDQTLNQVAPGAIEYRVLGGHVFLLFFHTDRITSEDKIGNETANETGFIVPLVEKQSGTLVPEKIVLWPAYAFIDSPIGMASGREIWGFNKTIGDTTILSPQRPLEFKLNTVTFTTLADATPKTDADLLKVNSTIPIRQPLRSMWNNPGALIDALNLELIDWELIWDEIIDIEESLLNFSFPLPLINLKEIRDAESTNSSALEQLVECQIKLEGNFAAGQLLDSHDQPIVFTAIVRDCRSHEIVRDMGLIHPRATNPPETSFPVEYAFWVKMDWTLPGGTIIHDASPPGVVRPGFSCCPVCGTLRAIVNEIVP